MEPESVAARLVGIAGVVGVTLGGSRARGEHTPDSDVDRVARSCRDAVAGRYDRHFQVGHPLGFPGTTYAGELARRLDSARELLQETVAVVRRPSAGPGAGTAR